MNLEEAVSVIERAVVLPGERAQRLMMPAYRREPEPVELRDGWREASVLVLLYPKDGACAFPLMQRTGGTGVHAGQVSLPGGAREGREALAECALRETYEELGVDARSVRVIKELTPLHVPPSRYVVFPFVGIVPEKPSFVPSPAEVEELLETSIDSLLDPGSVEQYEAERDGRTWSIPFYRLAGRRVWGATAMILSELARLLREGA